MFERCTYVGKREIFYPRIQYHFNNITATFYIDGDLSFVHFKALKVKSNHHFHFLKG